VTVEQQPVAAAARSGAGVGSRVGHGVSRLLLAPLYSLYTARLRHEVLELPVPRHIAVILDGNRRWASVAGLREPADGHRAGADKLDHLLDWCVRLGIDQVTVWALSNENLTRPRAELEGLLEVVAWKLESLAKLHARQSVRIRVFGRLDSLPARVRRSIQAVEAATAANEGLRLNIALGYSGRDELVDATRALVRRLAAEGISGDELAERVTADALASHLYTAGEPDPDLIIRTSGEVRLSGFLPWQGAHSELYFTDVYWPELRELDLLRALRTYQHRQRRFGR
jgi:short-chain Z-isoprenyl diphosphate synthase